MPKLQLGLGSDAANVEASTGFEVYDGPTPPAGVYPASVISIKFTKSSVSKKPMFKVFSKIDAPKGDAKGREKYNGYLMTDNLIIPGDRSEEHYGLFVGKINRLLDAMAGGDPAACKAARKALWGGQAVLDDSGEKVLSIGKDIKIKGGVAVTVVTKGETYKRTDKETGETTTEKTLRINDYHPPKNVAVKPADDDKVEYEDAEDDSDPIEEDETAAVAGDDVESDDSSDDVEPDDDGGADGDGDDAEPEDDADDAGDPDEADEADGQDLGLIAEEVPDDTPVTEEELVVERPARKRRSAF
ncbi:hypothetical protein SEA_MACGULLY_72 [Rhodococcus phage MacGully]|nr:hypothetical protein SEA_MACGULLY_72 [Rhodococcus phage MacGully]